MNKQNILIFGAGINQITLIRAAAALGLGAVVLDPVENAPGKPYADHFYRVDGEDYESSKALALKHNVIGIVSGQMEKPMRLMAKLAEELGFIFHSPEVTERSLDKWLMKQAFLQHGVACAKGILLDKDETLTADQMEGLLFPLVIKPKDATSSQGVLKVNAIEEMLEFLPVARSFSRSGQVIAEEFLDGPEYSVESITYRGETTIVQVTEKFVTPFPYTVEVGHLQPAPLMAEQRAEVEAVVEAAIKAIGIDNSASHTEVKRTPNGPKIVEIGARLGGDFIPSYLTYASCGVDMDKAAISVAIGRKPDLERHWERHSYIKYFSLPVGQEVLEVKDWREVLESPGVVFAHISTRAGDIIPPITESRKRPGFVIVEGDSREPVLTLADKYAAELAGCVLTRAAAPATVE